MRFSCRALKSIAPLLVFFLVILRNAKESTKTMISNFSDAVSTMVGCVINFAPIGIMGLVFDATNKLSLLFIYLTRISLRQLSYHPGRRGWGPCNLITTVKEPSIDNTNIMMEHPKIRMLVATGGPAIVKKVMSTGKKIYRSRCWKSSSCSR